MPTRQVRCRGNSLVLLQNRNDLLFGVLLAFHLGTSLGQNYRKIPHPTGLALRGYGQQHLTPDTRYEEQQPHRDDLAPTTDP